MEAMVCWISRSTAGVAPFYGLGVDEHQGLFKA
jgi:hypothetical protein